MINVTRPLTPSSTRPNHIKQQRLAPSQFECLTSRKIMKTEPPQTKQFKQVNYPQELYESEIRIHKQNFSEYDLDIYDAMVDLILSSRPNLQLYKEQPYLTFAIRLKLIDFLLKMSVRLKILPFVFFKAIKLFDRYCSKRIVLLEQSQLIITTCLWIASKIVGGNNHFVNLTNLDKIGVKNFKTIADLGYGSGGKYLGPTERFRLPKLHELVKLCGAKCKYDSGMFKQMEVHVLNTLEWSLNDPSIEEFIISSHEFCIINQEEAFASNEFFKIKEYISYASLYSHELIDVNVVELGQVCLDLINEVFKLSPTNGNYQTLLDSDDLQPIKFDMNRYRLIKRSLIKAILNSSDFLVKLFNTRGPRFLYQQICYQFSAVSTPMMTSTGTNTSAAASASATTAASASSSTNNPAMPTYPTIVSHRSSRSSSFSSSESPGSNNVSPTYNSPTTVSTTKSTFTHSPNHIRGKKIYPSPLFNNVTSMVQLQPQSVHNYSYQTATPTNSGGQQMPPQQQFNNHSSSLHIHHYYHPPQPYKVSTTTVTPNKMSESNKITSSQASIVSSIHTYKNGYDLFDRPGPNIIIQGSNSNTPYTENESPYAYSKRFHGSMGHSREH
ncbi:HGC1 [Candida oxycetoniae]|uniref:HGC1 n=1 Tax=Candida oxycetoniae TaxID=497107 RepID=A0AAI9SXZ9_9ASCO|nr:HGC1 [Candida oxycetoniae]KAI3404641.2 HGC1 [Candida oxycetoniae]